MNIEKKYCDRIMNRDPVWPHHDMTPPPPPSPHAWVRLLELFIAQSDWPDPLIYTWLTLLPILPLCSQYPSLDCLQSPIVSYALLNSLFSPLYHSCSPKCISLWSILVYQSLYLFFIVLVYQLQPNDSFSLLLLPATPPYFTPCSKSHTFFRYFWNIWRIKAF